VVDIDLDLVLLVPFFWKLTSWAWRLSLPDPRCDPKPAEEMKQDENIEINQRLGIVRKSPYNQSDLHAFTEDFDW